MLVDVMRLYEHMKWLTAKREARGFHGESCAFCRWSNRTTTMKSTEQHPIGSDFKVKQAEGGRKIAVLVHCEPFVAEFLKNQLTFTEVHEYAANQPCSALTTAIHQTVSGARPGDMLAFFMMGVDPKGVPCASGRHLSLARIRHSLIGRVKDGVHALLVLDGTECDLGLPVEYAVSAAGGATLVRVDEKSKGSAGSVLVVSGPRGIAKHFTACMRSTSMRLTIDSLLRQSLAKSVRCRVASSRTVSPELYFVLVSGD